MKTKLLSLLMLVITVVSGCASLPHYKTAEGSYKFEFKLSRGESINYIEKTGIEVTSNVPQIFPDIKVNVKGRTNSVVKTIKENGNYLITEKLSDVDLGRNVPKFNKQFPLSIYPVSLYALMEALDGKSSELEFTKNYKIVNFKNDETVMNIAAKRISAALGLGESGVSNIENAIRKSMNAYDKNNTALIDNYPGKPVKIGDSWEKNMSSKIMDMNINYKLHYTFKRVEEGKYAIIEVTGGAPESEVEGQPMKIKTSVEARGSIKLNMTNGIAENSNIETNIGISIEINSNNPNAPRELEMNMKSTSSIEMAK